MKRMLIGVGFAAVIGFTFYEWQIKEPFSSMLREDIYKIEAEVADGEGPRIYSTTDEGMISLFEEEMNDMSWRETDQENPSVFHKAFALYAEDGSVIAEVVFVGENIAHMKGEYFVVDEVDLVSFTTIFFEEEYKQDNFSGSAITLYPPLIIIEDDNLY
ncbi:hypothetical protein LCM20_08720 [Halobacillus litoralis]|uniref:hypothetical protein n=1 Tax=Halobacillus litoralis TaxID=45668 RepID=UPI001CD7966A|nr:hypothetical protein [Halobacillus litoralis]MCA0970668.1 hypothetical protein [Halobacillus litoralis]